MKIVYPLNQGTPVHRDIKDIHAERAMCTHEDVSRLQYKYDELVALRHNIPDDDPLVKDIEALQTKLLARTRSHNSDWHKIMGIESTIDKQRGAIYESDALSYQVVKHWRWTVDSPPIDHPILTIEFQQVVVLEADTDAFTQFFCQQLGWESEHFLRAWGFLRFVYYALDLSAITPDLPQRLEKALAAWKAAQTETKQKETA